MIPEVLHEAEHRMQGAITSLETDLSGFRTGRASPHLIDKLHVEIYGVEIPLYQAAVISVPEPQQLAIRPYDANTLGAIERAIMKSDLGIMPNNDGKILRLNLPRLTEQRRRELSKMVAKRVEEGRVAARNIRRDSINDLRDFKNEKMISEDELFQGQESLQELTDKYIAKMDEMGKAKEAELMEF